MSSAPTPVSNWKTALRDFSVRAMGWFVPMFITAAATAWLTYEYTQKANTELMMQQQKLSELQQFRSSGAQFEQALSRMSDAIVDGEGVETARRDMRDAIARNITDADAIRDELGSGTDEYIAKMAQLRVVVDETDTDSGEELWAGSLDLMERRRRLISEAERRRFD